MGLSGMTRNIGAETPRMHAGEPCRKFVGIRDEGQDRWVWSGRKLGAKVSGLAKAFGLNVIGGARTDTRSEAMPESASATTPRRSCSQPTIFLRPCGAEPAVSGDWWELPIWRA